MSIFAEPIGPVGFEAQYPGVCDACDGPIRPGQMIDRNADMLHGGYVHATCPDHPPKLGPVCAKCFQARALNGRCSCDD